MYWDFKGQNPLTGPCATNFEYLSKYRSPVCDRQIDRRTDSQNGRG